MRRGFGHQSILLLVASAFWVPLFADAIVVSKAMKASTILEVFIERDRIRVELEIGASDLEAFRNLLPAPLYERLELEPRSESERLREFFQNDLIIRKEGTSTLPGQIVEMEVRERIRRDQITGEPVPVATGQEETVLFVKLVYHLVGSPKQLSFTPPRSREIRVVANIGFVTYHLGLPVNDFRYLGQEETLLLNWEDPWYSEFENRNLRRQYYSPISAFLYIEPYEVRKEIVVRPKDLEQWVDLGLEGKSVIAVSEQEELKAKVADFLASKNPVTIDGETSKGKLDRIHFIYRNLKTSGVIDPPRDLDALSATLGIIFVYPTDGLPQEVAMEWELFSDQIQALPAAATDEAGGLPYRLTLDDRILRWQNFLKNPTIPRMVAVEAPPGTSGWLIALLLLVWLALLVPTIRAAKEALQARSFSKKSVGYTAATVLLVCLIFAWLIESQGPSDEEAQVIVGGLLSNIYQAFDFRDEEVIYDALGHSASGDLLTQIYLETRRSLELQNQGGARVKVKNVEMLTTKSQSLGSDSGFEAVCTWNASGSVGHWGHIHQRTNQYEARLVVIPIDGAWKITQLEILQEVRT
jgi:hypothetical protein